jgi:hypothetical protein
MFSAFLFAILSERVTDVYCILTFGCLEGKNQSWYPVPTAGAAIRILLVAIQYLWDHARKARMYNQMNMEGTHRAGETVARTSSTQSCGHTID